jgi:hypothetical protein
LLKEVPAKLLVILAAEVECLGDVGAGQRLEECFANFRAREWRCRRKVVCDCKTVVVPWELSKCQGIENLIWEGRDERGLGEELDCALIRHEMSAAIYHYRIL